MAFTAVPRVRRHRASKPLGSSERVLPWQITMDQLIFASLSHTHYWYEVEMLKYRASHRTSASSRTKMPFTGPNARASKQPYARGGCCGRGRYSALVTTGYPRGSRRESSRTRGNVDRGGRRKSGRTAWQMIFGYLASRGTGEPPHLTLGYGITRYKKGVIDLWPRE